MVYCVAFNCKTRSGQGVGLFEFPKDEKRRKVWISRIKRKDFRLSKTSRLCAKHFTNDQFVVDPLLAMTIGYKLRKLQLKSDAIPSVFDFEVKKKGNDNADSFKRKQRQSGAVAKRKRIETLAQILEVSSDSDQNDNTCTINEGKETPHESNTEQLTATYNASCYIDDLFDELLIRREMYTSYSEAFDAKQREDKVRPAPLAQALPRQSKNEIVNRHISRFNLD
ncbi:hypothetical protein ACJMK2_002409 [Sinanodonta woodiana]|uniref:THAP-type domain-containing protein n=1 Tax=Sinanodonta woodiana TaxID=1069815 RepID=A0ABD3XX18_SINWO